MLKARTTAETCFQEEVFKIKTTENTVLFSQKSKKTTTQPRKTSRT